MRADSSLLFRALALLLALAVGLWSPGSAADDAEQGAAAKKKPAAEAAPFDEIMRSNAPGPRPSRAAADGEPASPPDSATVEVPLAEYTDIARRIEDMRRAGARDTGPRVVLGGASYEGEVKGGVLSLRVKLHVTLAGEGPKTVPLVGDDVALVSAVADNEPLNVGRDSAFAGPSIGVTRRPGYHVWVTDRRGLVAIELSLLVAPRGPRGSIEYAFRAARTPSTSLTVRLPTEGLAPRFDGAVLSEVRSEKGGTTVRATLTPTTEIRMVGFRDLGTTEEHRTARVYAETSTLLSVDERAIELFTVARYNILYAAAQSFEISVPEGLDIVSADGAGAFRYTVERREGATVLRGETAFPVQGNYEISLRLRSKSADAPLGAPPAAARELHVVLPRCLGVEREHGWLAVEVPGNLRLDEASRQDLVGVDVRQLPSEVVGSAVSPILRAYRYHRPSPELRLTMERLPEEELADGAIDRIDAVSVLSPEGKLLTELRITLRNTLRPSLALTLPEATEVRSALLDGEPVKPSRNERGELLLPLKRSRGEERQEPFALELVLESERPPLRVLGAAELTLPAVDLTAASLHWQLHLPAHNHYGDVRAAMTAQTYAGAASWHKPPHLTRAVRWDDTSDAQRDAASPSAAPARFELPRTGVALAYQRYWISGGEAVRVEVPFVRAWLLLPAKLLLAVLLAAGIGMAPLTASAAPRLAPRAAQTRRARLARAGRIVVCAAIGLASWRLGGPLHACGAALAGLALLVERRVPRERIVRALREVLTPLPGRVSAWWRRQVWPRNRAARALALSLCSAVVAWMLVERLGRFVRALAEIAGFTA